MSETSDLPGESYSASEVVAYQAGSIVSRILLKSAGGSITAFAFDRGQELSEHTTPFDALVAVVEGEVEIRIAGKRHTVSEGRMIRLPANVPHALKALTPFKMMLTMLKG